MVKVQTAQKNYLWESKSAFSLWRNLLSLLKQELLPTPCNLLVLTFISLLMLNDPFYICRLRSSSSICLWNFKPHTHSPFHVLSDSLSVISRPHFILFLICIYISSLLSFFMLANYHIFSLFDLVPFSKIFVPPWPYQFNRWLVIVCTPLSNLTWECRA